MTECLRLNRVCKFENMARKWPATRNWNFKKNGAEYLKEKLNEQVSVFVTNDHFNLTTAEGESFKQKHETKMKYSDFLKRMNT